MRPVSKYEIANKKAKLEKMAEENRHDGLKIHELLPILQEMGVKASERKMRTVFDAEIKERLGDSVAVEKEQQRESMDPSNNLKSTCIKQITPMMARNTIIATLMLDHSATCATH